MEKILKSGAKLVVSMADFEHADTLRKAVIKVSKGLTLGPNLMDVEMEVLKNVIAEFASSDEIESAIFKCALKAHYENRKINPDLFNDPEIGIKARKDFHEMMYAIAWENLGPFFDQALSALNPILKKHQENLKPSLQPVTA